LSRSAYNGDPHYTILGSLASLLPSYVWMLSSALFGQVAALGQVFSPSTPMPPVNIIYEYSLFIHLSRHYFSFNDWKSLNNTLDTYSTHSQTPSTLVLSQLDRQSITPQQNKVNDKHIYILSLTILGWRRKPAFLERRNLANRSTYVHHSFITPKNAHLTHKNIVLYCSYFSAPFTPHSGMFTPKFQKLLNAIVIVFRIILYVYLIWYDMIYLTEIG
jgi:hypothetical protein